MLNLRTRREGGLTMIEVIVASIILAAIVAMSGYLVWNTSKTVAAAEVGVQMETNAREFLSTLTKELHQSRISEIKYVNWDSTTRFDSSTPTAFTSATLPGTGISYNPSKLSTVAPGTDGIIPTTATTFSILRFKIPGKSLDITKSNANLDKDPQAFDLATWKSDGGKFDKYYNVEIQYWWEVDNSYMANEGVGGNGAGGYVPDNKDNNRNGVIDEGVIKRVESRYDVNGNLQERHVSTVLRDVPYIWDPAFPADWTKGRPGLVFCIPNTDGGGSAYASTGIEKRIYVNLTLEKQDPRYPNLPKKNYYRTFSTYVDVRNPN